MKPDPALVLQAIGTALVTDVAPLLPTSYAQQLLAGTATILAVAQEELDRAAARRVEENAALRRLFGAAAGVVADPALGAALAAAAGGAESSLRVSDLDVANRTLRALLVRLHAHVEELAGDAARALEADIWAELRASTERRRTMLGNF